MVGAGSGIESSWHPMTPRWPGGPLQAREAVSVEAAPGGAPGGDGAGDGRLSLENAGRESDAGIQGGSRPPAALVAWLQAALDFIEDGVIVCDGDAMTVFRNRAAEGHFGGGADEVLAHQAIGEALQLALRNEYPERTLELFAPSPRRLVIRAFPLSGPVDERGAVAIVEDASARHRLDAIRRDFVANVSHELKTPVGALSLLAETLDGEEDPDVVARLATRVAAEAERLGQIIDDLLDLSRIEANEAPGREMVPLAVIVGQAVELLRAVAKSSDVELEVDDPPRQVAVPGDRRDLVSAVSNLVDNAIKYSERGSLVQVRTRVDQDAVEIAVIDQGVGIPPRDLERIFERFYRVDRARSRLTGGTGLGLSIVRHVAANHFGSVRVESREGEGSTFTLRLPIRHGDSSSPAPAAAASAGPATASPTMSADHVHGGGDPVA
jgi:two-component system, OmpR family, sensor histidine kinase SenX3